MPHKLTQTIISSLVVIAVAGIGIWLAIPQEQDTSAQTSAHNTSRHAPEFSLPTLSGDSLALSDITAPVTVVNLWASWCPFCTKELPAFKRLQQAFPEQIRVVAINRGETKQQAQSFIDNTNLGNQLTFLLDKDESYYRAIGGFAMPETLFLNADKQIVRHQRGPLSFEQMKRIVKKILSTATTTSLRAGSSSKGCMAGVCRPDTG